MTTKLHRFRLILDCEHFEINDLLGTLVLVLKARGLSVRFLVLRWSLDALCFVGYAGQFFSLANVEDYREVSEGRANGVETSAWMELFFKEITVASRTLQE